MFAISNPIQKTLYEEAKLNTCKKHTSQCTQHWLHNDVTSFQGLFLGCEAMQDMAKKLSPQVKCTVNINTRICGKKVELCFKFLTILVQPP